LQCNFQSAFFIDLSSCLSSSLYAQKIQPTFKRGTTYSSNTGKNAVALLTAKSKVSLYFSFFHISSALPFIVSIFFNHSSDAKLSTAFSFFQTLSIHTNWQSGFVIARGIRGNPQPVPISATFHSNSIKIFKNTESIKCLFIIHFSSLIAERFILEFFSIKIFKNSSNFLISFSSNSILFSKNSFFIWFCIFSLYFL